MKLSKVLNMARAFRHLIVFAFVGFSFTDATAMDYIRFKLQTDSDHKMKAVYVQKLGSDDTLQMVMDGYRPASGMDENGLFETFAEYDGGTNLGGAAQYDRIIDPSGKSYTIWAIGADDSVIVGPVTYSRSEFAANCQSQGFNWIPVEFTPPKTLVDADEFELTIDTRTERTAIAGSTESFTIPDAVWETAGGNPVTVTYTKDGGAAQTLGSYKQGDKVEWIPTAGGDYTFTFGSNEYQASFHVDKTPGIFITSAKQRWPWNGMVDIGYFVEGLDPEKEYTATFHVTCKGETKSFTLAGIVNGDATTAWDAAAATAWGKTLVKEPATVSADLRCLTVKVPEPWGTYMIVDLTKLGQAGCVTTETKESAEAACNAYNRDEYKTTKLVLRKVAKGQAYPVKPGATADLTDTDVMTPQKDYYIGVFMITKAQYDYVMGTSTTSTDKNPTQSLTYNEIRKNDISGAMSPLDPVCNDSFMHRLVKGCLDQDGNAVGSFDLPTEIQWEIACRAGSFAERGSYLNASWEETTLTQGTIKSVVCGSALAAVGTYRPNAWGLYDMLGDLWEWCLDESIAAADYTHTDVETPYYSGSSDKRMCRGYYYNTMAVSIRPGGQNVAQDASSTQYWNGGIRVCHVVEE